MQKLVLLSGKKGSGKDTLAEMLKPNFSRASFADPLYLEVQEAFSLETQDLLRNRDTKEVPTEVMKIRNCHDLQFQVIAEELGIDLDEPQSPRRILQLWGTEYRQTTDGSMYWVDKLIDLVSANPYVDFCVPDLRFPHEYSGIFEYCLAEDVDLVVVRIERDVEDDSTSSHASETALNGFDIFDFTVINEEGSPEKMKESFLAQMG